MADTEHENSMYAIFFDNIKVAFSDILFQKLS